jgi:bifunctional non-homologous end joining protein LigD
VGLGPPISRRSPARGRAGFRDFIPPQLATLADAAPGADSWLHEVKLDGYRLLARIDGARVKLVTRRGNDWTEKFEPIVTALASLKVRSAMLDGEIVHLNPDGTSSFGALQEDMSEERPDRLCYFLFDLLALDGHPRPPAPPTNASRRSPSKQQICCATYRLQTGA